MRCPYCNEFRGNSKVRGYPVKEQLIRHIEVNHKDKLMPKPTLKERG